MRDEVQTVFVQDPCPERIPPSLWKASQDKPFDYACRLTTGEIVFFSGATISGEWVTLTLGWPDSDPPDVLPTEELRIAPPRGLDVKISSIAWCADAFRA